MSTRLTRPAHDARLRSLRERLSAAKADALLVTNPRDIRYLTGFVGDDSWALVTRAASRPASAAHRPGRGLPVHVLSDFRFREQIEREAPQVIAVMRKKTLADTLAVVARRLNVRRLAVQPGHTTLTLRGKLGKTLKGVRLLEQDDGLLEQRALKDGQEVDLIRHSLAIQQKAYRRTLDRIRPGMSESAIAARLEYEMRTLGADGTSFPSIVAADANAALPHAIPGPSPVRAGGILLIDWGACYHGYCSDMTRVIALGSMPRRMREVYRIVLEAQRTAIDAIRPGARLRDVDAAARRIITRAGYGDRFGHGTGHGLGLNIHESPSLSRLAEGELRPGHVVTVEPGIYLPGVGGVRIEDDVLVLDPSAAGGRSREVLSDLPKDLDSAII